ncbi:MAG: hypothetical protein HW390_913 [Candidatus Brocadiaceae bacterium]|nr:hypothetical protein [Candidatus Brocadiaceae bacterium]
MITLYHGSGAGNFELHGDVFICHASEDKASVVEPLYQHLDSVGIRCWCDRGEILWGDSLVGKINEGLK